MKHLIKTTLLLLALLLPTLTHAFVVDGIYYYTNGSTATVTSSPSGNKYSGSVTIPATVTYGGTTYSVTSIGGDAFYRCSSLTAINIPNSVTNIGNSAFYGCSSLTNINIPNSVTYIGTNAFYCCSSLTTIDIPNSVTSIGYYAFYNCTSLTTINIPNSVTYIGGDAFFGTAWYNNQPDGLIYVGMVAYKYKGTMPEGTIITLKEGTTGIAGSTFSNCSNLTNINIPNSVTTIDERAFSGCSSLTNINIPNSVTSIGGQTFSGCSSLTNINIPNSVTYISEQMFADCSSLTNINIPNSVTTIEVGAFSGCSSLTNINIPNSVIYIDGWEFSGCSSLTNITVASDNPNFDSRNNCNAIIETATNTLIAGCMNTTIPNSVTAISYGAFAGCSSLTAINIPNSVTAIDDYTFYGCSSLTTINIPNSVSAIGGYTFYDCSSLTAINIPNSVISIGDYAFYGCSSLITINIPNSVTSIGFEAYSNCSSLTTINIPNSVSAIGGYTFYDCSSLTTINIPSSVTSIYGAAFGACFSLNDVYCYAATPPKCDDENTPYGSSFDDYSATLHVPATSLAAYFTAPVWCNFENIVGDAIEPTGIAISRDSVEIQSGEQIELTASVTPANASCKEVTWYSTDPSVATVEDGVVTAVSYGECDIFAYCMGMPAVCHITVANRISLGQQEAMLLPNHILTLTPSAPAMPSGFTVTSSDPTVAAARVMSGKVQIVGIKEGTTTITVASTDGTAQPATCLVTVYTEPGDANCDGFVTIADVTGLLDFMLGSESTSIKEANADLNGDGHITIADATILIDQLLTTAN